MADIPKLFDFIKFERKHNLVITQRYKDFINNELTNYTRSYIYLPETNAEFKFSIKFLKPSYKLFEEMEIDIEEDDISLLPLAKFNDYDILAVDTAKENCPVLIWDPSNYIFKELYNSLDHFLKDLLKKEDKIPFEKLKTAVAKAEKLYENSSTKAIQILNEVAEVVNYFLKLNRIGGYETKEYLKSYLNLKGSCYIKIGQVDDAISCYKQAIELKDPYAAFNLIDFFIDKHEYENAYKIAEKLIDKLFLANEYCLFYAYFYHGICSIYLGYEAKANASFKKIFEVYESSEEDYFEIAKNCLLKMIDDKITHYFIAEKISEWFQHLAIELSVQQRADNRKWWDSLPNYSNYLQKHLLAAKNLDEKHVPTDEEIYKILKIENLSFNNGEEISDINPIVNLSALKYLKIYSTTLTSIETLKQLKALSYVVLNDKIIKDFKLPNKQEQQLFDALKNGNLTEAKRLIDLGIDVNAKDDAFSQSPLHLLISNNSISDKEKIEFATYLIKKGADLYAQNDDDGDVLDYLSPDKTQKLIAIYNNHNPIKEIPFFIWDRSFNPNCIDLSYIIDGNNSGLSRGISCIHEWPDNASYTVRSSQKNIKLTDALITQEGYVVISASLKQYLEDKQIKEIEYLSVKILNSKEEIIGTSYYLLHILGLKDCLDIEKSEPTYNFINPEMIKKVKRVVIDENNLGAGIQIFRIKNYNKQIYIRKNLADEMVNQGFSGLFFKTPKR